MNDYRQAMQHYITLGQHTRCQTNLSCLGISIFSMLFIDLLFGIKRVWWGIGVFTIIFILAFVSILLIKDYYKRIFYEFELLCVSFLLLFAILAMFLIEFLCSSFVYAVVMCLLALVVCTFFVQLDFIRKLKKDYYKDISVPKTKEKSSIWIALIIVFLVHTIIRLFVQTSLKDFVKMLVLIPLLLIVFGLFGALIFMSFQKIYFVFKYKLDLNPNIEE